MDLKIIKELIQLLEKSSVQRMTVKEKNGFEVTLDKGAPSQGHHLPLSANKPHQAIPPAPVTQPMLSDRKEKGSKDEIDPRKCVASPMVGTVYHAESPESQPFKQVGDRVSVGEVICIIEAMKVMNEVKSDKQGKVTKILIEDGSPVEYGQCLFLIE